MARADDHDAVEIRKMAVEEADATAHVAEGAFNSFNKLVGLPPEFDGGPPVESFRTLCTTPDVHVLVAISAGEIAEAKGGSIVGTATLDMRGTVAAIGCVAVAPSWWDKRLGRRLMQAALDVADHAEHGKTCVMLQQVASNTKSFSLYASLGFVIVENCLRVGGHVRPALSMPSGYSLRQLDADRDTMACDALFGRMFPGYTRVQEIQAYLAEGGKAGLKAATVGVWRNDDSQGERLVAYTTGMGLAGHLVAEDRIAFKALLIGLSTELRQAGSKDVELGVHFLGRLYPDMLPWVLRDSGLRLQRQTTLMARGGPVPTVKDTRMIYCPSVNY